MGLANFDICDAQALCEYNKCETGILSLLLSHYLCYYHTPMILCGTPNHVTSGASAATDRNSAHNPGYNINVVAGKGFATEGKYQN